MKKDCFILGTRPEVIKFAPLILKMKPIVINTGQHKKLADEALQIFKIEPDYDLGLMRADQTPSEFVGNAILALQSVIETVKPDRIWVLGDTSTAYAGALVAYLNKIKLVHIEAGLRTKDYNNPFPEEMFRTQIDKMADVLFAPTQANARNLKQERGETHIVGNLIVDALKLIKPTLSDTRPVEEPYILMTMHRRENFGDDMRHVFETVKKLKTTVIFPAHPNPNVRKMAKEVGIQIIEPLNYIEFLWHLKHCQFVMSDSGGIQEEVPSFDKPILILRKTTERQEILTGGLAMLTDLTEKDLLKKIKLIQTMSQKQHNRTNPFGDGHTADKIKKIMR